MGAELCPVDQDACRVSARKGIKGARYGVQMVFLSESFSYNRPQQLILTPSSVPLSTWSSTTHTSLLSSIQYPSTLTTPRCLSPCPKLPLPVYYHSSTANMSAHSYYPHYPSAPLPISMPQKPGYYYPHPQHAYGRVSASPPEAPESVTTSGVPSYEPSATSSSYAGSASDYDSSGTTTGVDLLEYMGDRLNGSFDATPLDRSLAKQAQT